MSLRMELCRTRRVAHNLRYCNRNCHTRHRSRIIYVREDNRFPILIDGHGFGAAALHGVAFQTGQIFRNGNHSLLVDTINLHRLAALHLHRQHTVLIRTDTGRSNPVRHIQTRILVQASQFHLKGKLITSRHHITRTQLMLHFLGYNQITAVDFLRLKRINHRIRHHHDEAICSLNCRCHQHQQRHQQSNSPHKGLLSHEL